MCLATSEPIRDGAIAVEHGRIVLVGPRDEVLGLERVRYPGCVLIPGFVNTHAHLELTIFHGLLENLAFGDWIAKLVRIKYSALDRDALRASARLGALEMLHAGITTVGEVMDAGTGWEAMREFGLQGVAYQEVFGPGDDTAPESLHGLQARVRDYRRQETATRRIGISPHAPYTVSQKLYETARDYARSEKLLMTAHIAESHDETLFVRDGAGHFGDAHRKRGIQVKARHCSPVAYLERLGLLGPDMLLVHAIETGEEDLRRIRDTGSFVAHCPRSNAKLGHQVAHVAEMRELGIPVSLGTDSTASNDSIDIFAEMRLAMAQQGLSASEAFSMATIEGARALGLDPFLGSLDLGKRADFVIVDTDGVVDNPLDAMVNFASGARVKTTFLSGTTVSMDASEGHREVERIKKSLFLR